MTMPSVRYSDSLKKLSSAHRKLVKDELSLWKKNGTSGGIDCKQLAKNIESENSLSVTSFTKLLRSFAIQLESSASDISFWNDACAAHELHGPAVPVLNRPKRLGRATKVKDYANHIGRNVAKSAAYHQLTKNAGKRKPMAALKRKMLGANLSAGRVLWGTFSLPPETDPLAGMPTDTDGVATCLGLGANKNSDAFIVMRYEVPGASSPSLHKPTVADAGTYSFFRPGSSPTEHWGMTWPLKPNPKKLKGRPELVHAQITGQALVFPYVLSV